MSNPPNPNEYYTLLTGATGLVGRYLLKDFLLANVRVAVVVRNSKKEQAEARLDRICEFWERQLKRELPRPVCLTGDVRFANLGMSDPDLKWVKANCRSCFHNAAILKFQSSDRDQEPWVTNLEGTRNVVGLCEDVGIDDFHYVSTAYVCGDRMDLIQEDDLDCGQGFRNDYEHSKFMAEQLVRESSAIKHKTIYRPAVITADSSTGYTNTYHGLHLYLRLMSLLVPQVEPDENGIRQTRISLPMTGDEQRNVVTVDWVSKVMTALFLNPEAHGRTFHLSPESKLTPKSVIDYCYRYFGSAGVVFAGSRKNSSESQSSFEKNFLGNVGIYASYDTSDPNFDTKNLKRFAGHIPCPEIDENAIHQFLEFGEADKWGKRKHSLREIEFPVNQHADELKTLAIEMRRLLTDGNSPSDAKFELGFDVVGVGGGQWCYQAQGNRLVRGLPHDPDSSIVRITSKSLWRILNDRKTNTKNQAHRGNRVPEKLAPQVMLGKPLMSYVDADAYL